MNVLFITPYVPNLIRVRPLHLIRSLVRRGHHLTLVTLWTTEEERAELEQLADLGIHVVAQQLPLWRSLSNSLLALPTRTPLQAVYCWQPALARQIRQLVAKRTFDVIHIEHLRGATYGLHAQSMFQHIGVSLPIIWDSVDCISHLFEQAAQNSRSLKGRLMTRLDLDRTRAYEGKLVRQFSQVLVTSPTDQVALANLAGCPPQPAPFLRLGQPVAAKEDTLRSNIHVLANGVDLEYFTLNNALREPAALVLSGKMSYHANITTAIHLVKNIMPLVWAQRPDVNVWIAGKDPAPDVRALDTNRHTLSGRVVVTGTVSDIRPYLQKSTLAVAPVPYGAGIQNKVLEAMACGAAVVASSQACSALQAQPGRDLLLADDAGTFANHILHLLADPSRRDELGRRGREYVENLHSWNAVAAQLEQIYQTAILQHHAQNPVY
jgi:polysaccharide biosynthesis protein PslH